MDADAAPDGSSIPADATIATGVWLDVLQLHQRTGRRFLVDYLGTPQFIRSATHEMQGWARADYVVMSGSDPIPASLRRVVMRIYKTSKQTYAIARVDADAERAWRRERGYPEPTPAR